MNGIKYLISVKSLCSPLKEFFEISSTWYFYPEPPIALKRLIFKIWHRKSVAILGKSKGNQYFKFVIKTSPIALKDWFLKFGTEKVLQFWAKSKGNQCFKSGAEKRGNQNVSKIPGRTKTLNTLDWIILVCNEYNYDKIKLVPILMIFRR